MSFFDFLRRRPSAATTPPPEPAAESPLAAMEDSTADELTIRGRNGAGEIPRGLLAAQLRLVKLKTMYKTGNYSGHPEEMLEDIEFAEARVRRLKADNEG